ncbi:OmpW family outer membrane protein [uncultured Cetobacterium sp.]|uniref:OmpW family outer membrane protein n=1 Tax=uncultured Cetobacterium sp. TaxID=527638 RepID=UPI002605B988|nr:OmpW family outer membrane protein [uncultured Cetobacterium sp.]
MKKLMLLSFVLSLSSISFARDKEAIVQPQSVEIMEASEPIIEAIPVETAPIITEQAINTTSMNHIYFRVGGDVYSKYSKYSEEGTKYSNGKTKGLGYEAAIEGTRNISDNLELGLGIAYQSHSKNKASTEVNSTNNESSTIKIGKYDSIPLYVTGKYNIGTDSAVKPYLKANLGYSFNINEKNTTASSVQNGQNTKLSLKTKVDDGLYAGVGAGFEYNDYLVDLMYQTNFAKASIENEIDARTSSTKSKLDYSRVTLSIGYKFNI